MEARPDCFPALRRHVEEHQAHSWDLLNPLGVLQRIHQQDAAESMPLMPFINREVAEEDCGDQVRARRSRGSFCRQIGLPMAWALMAQKPRQE